LSWQRPNGPTWRELCSRAGVALTLCVPALLPARSAPAEQPYALIGRAAPDFALHAAAGANVRLSEHRGEVVVVSFWSSYCGTCRTQLAALNRSLSTYRSAGLTVYGVGVDDNPAATLDFARSLSVGFEMLLDPSKGVSRSYQVDNLPMTVLIDRGGTVRHVLRDFSPASNALYMQEVRALLDE